MEKRKNVVSVLNHLLDAEVLDDQLLEASFGRFTSLIEPMDDGKESLQDGSIPMSYPGIVWMDFETHSKEKQEDVRLQKLQKVVEQNFEAAANLRDMEKECITYRRFKKHYGLEQSTFVIIEGFLIYAYFGNARNDLRIRDFLDKGKWLSQIKVDGCFV